MKFRTRLVAQIAAFSVFALSTALGTLSASAVGEPVPAPLSPSISVYDATVTQFESIEVRGLNFPANSSVLLRVTEQLVTVPDPNPDAPPPPVPHSFSADVAVQDDGSFPVGYSVDETSRTFAEVFTDNSWPAGDYKVTATYTDDLGEPATTNAVDMTVSTSDVTPALSSSDLDANGAVEQGKTFEINGSGWPADATGNVSVSLHQFGHAAEVLTYETGVLSIVNGALTGENTYIVPESTTPGNYSVELNMVAADGATTSFARFPLNVAEKYVPPVEPPVVDPPVDPPPVVDPPVDPPPVVDPPLNPPVVTPPVVVAPPVAVPMPPKKPTVMTPKVTVGESDTTVTEVAKKTDVESTGKADPKPSTDDQSELESLPGLTFSDKGKNTKDVTLAGSPQTDSISTTPLLIVLAAMGLLVGGVSVALKRFNA